MERLNDVQYLGLLIWIIALGALVYWARTFDKAHYDLLGKRKYFFALSTILVICSLGMLATKGLKKGLDFSGGTIIEMGSYRETSSKELQEIMKEFPGLGSVSVQTGSGMVDDLQPAEGDPKQFQRVIVRLTLEGGAPLDPAKTREAIDHLDSKLGGTKELRTASIGPTISGELTNNAIKALALALGAQLIYLFFRFGHQIRYGIAADIAMIHDVIIMLGFYSLAGREIDSPFVAALLTIVGYSVMDSVVIFDRIRENLNDWWAEHGEDQTAPYNEIVNASLCQTMSRSVNTTLTTLITLLAIFYFGGETLQNFAFALLVGIVGGAYSSVGLASPILCAINEKYPAKPPTVSSWDDPDEIVPEHHMDSGNDEIIYEDDDMPRSGGRRRSRGKRS